MDQKYNDLPPKLCNPFQDSIQMINRNKVYFSLNQYERNFIKYELERTEREIPEGLEEHDDFIMSHQIMFKKACERLVEDFKKSTENGLPYTILHFDELCNPMSRKDTFDPRTLDRHSSYYIPFYFRVCGSSRKKEFKQKPLPQKKVERNVRPKGTHTHCKFYR